MPVTRPAEDTVATAVFDDCHVAWLVTSCVAPPAIVAVAVNWDVPPTTGAVPLTRSDDAIVAEVVGFAHAMANIANPPAITIALKPRAFICSSRPLIGHGGRRAAAMPCRSVARRSSASDRKPPCRVHVPHDVDR